MTKIFTLNKRFTTLTLSFALLTVAPHANAQGVLEGGFKALDDWLTGQVVKPNTLQAAIMRIKQQPRNYLVRIQEVGGGSRLCEIQSINAEPSTGWIAIDFNYRGGTRLNLSPESKDSFVMSGAYKINMPLLGTSDVRVRLMFSPDGSAMGRWNNMGFDGSFDFVKVR
jgi:hypothetical protein